MPEANVALHPLVKELSKSFVVQEGRLAMSPDDVKKHVKTLQAVAVDERDAVAVHLVALAHRFRDQAGETGEAAIVLLIGFTMAVLGNDKAKTADMFASAGLAKVAAAVIGHTEDIKAPRAEDAPRKNVVTVKAKRGLTKKD